MLDTVSGAAVEARSNAIYDVVSAIVDVAAPAGERLIVRVRPRPGTNYELVWGRGKNRETESTGTRDYEEAQRYKRRKQFQLDTAHLAASDPRRLSLATLLESMRANYEITFPADAQRRSASIFAEMRPKADRLIALLGHLRVGDLRQETLNQYREVCRGRVKIIQGKRLVGLPEALAQTTIARDTEWLIRLINEGLTEAGVGWRPAIESLEREPRKTEFLTEEEFWRLCTVFEHGRFWDESKNDWLTEWVTIDGKKVRCYVVEPVPGGEWKLRFVIFLGFSGTREKRGREMQWFLSPDHGCVDFRADGRVVIHRRGYGQDPAIGKRAESSYVLPYLADRLRAWNAQDQETGSFYLFHQGGRPIRSNPWEEITKAARRAGIKKHVTCHTLKHTAITMMLKAGMNPHQVGVLTSTSTAVVERIYHHWTLDESEDLEDFDGIFGSPSVLS